MSSLKVAFYLSGPRANVRLKALHGLARRTFPQPRWQCIKFALCSPRQSHLWSTPAAEVPFYTAYDVLRQSSAACKALKVLKTTVLKRLRYTIIRWIERNLVQK